MKHTSFPALACILSILHLASCTAGYSSHCDGTIGELQEALDNQNSEEALALLSGDKVNTDATCETHPTPVLHRAAILGYAPLVRQLLAQGAFVDKPDSNGRTALMEAAANGRLSVAREILIYKKRFNKNSIFYKQALHKVAQGDQEEAVKETLQQIATINQQDNKGYTALMEAVGSPQAAGKIALIKMLIDMPQDFTLKNNLGLTALDIATSSYKQAMADNSQHRQFYGLCVAQLKRKS